MRNAMTIVADDDGGHLIPPKYLPVLEAWNAAGSPPVVIYPKGDLTLRQLLDGPRTLEEVAELRGIELKES